MFVRHCCSRFRLNEKEPVVFLEEKKGGIEMCSLRVTVEPPVKSDCPFHLFFSIFSIFFRVSFFFFFLLFLAIFVK